MPTIQNDFLPFATGPGANVVDQATYAALTALATGFVSGTAQSVQLNKVWRQSSIMAAVIAQFIVAQSGQAAVDDGTTPTLLANFTKAVNAASKQRVILTDTGSVNALAAANAVPMTALPTVSGVVQTIAVKVTNTGASTYSPDGLASRPIFGLGGAALQGGEMVANGIATLVSYVGPLLNGGALCWVLFECIGGAQQVAPATQGSHALQQQQKGLATYTSNSTFTVPPGVTTIFISGTAGGGGGGGAAGNSGNANNAGGGSGGGAGQSLIRAAFTVAPGQVIPITIGAGGAGGPGGAAGANNGTAGTSGGNTTIGSLATLSGGGGGGGGLIPGGGSGSSGFPGGGLGMDGIAYGGGGAGGSGPFGGGGGAVRGTSVAGGGAGRAAGGYGSGGGGGGACYAAASSTGGAGAPGSGGHVQIEW
ncbi:hypothetical protein [Burkholderia anthina]|uniref:hypothetical protein n=1 Tax=Burkholderia anthina TaxID=179879 RepID=UPI000A98ECB9|nr:hypothetical protein [Burkholderia anthina]